MDLKGSETYMPASFPWKKINTIRDSFRAPGGLGSSAEQVNHP